MHDILIPYVKNNSGELETCITLIKRNLPHRDIYVIEKCDKSPYLMPPHIDQIMKIKWAIENLDVTDEFYLFNDDFFVIQPVGGIGYFHKGLMADQIARRRRNDWYKESLIKTSEMLGTNALSYELHLPFLMDKHKFYAMTDLFDLEAADVPHMRSAYGNIFEVGGIEMEDVKNIPDFEGATFLSTSDGSFKYGSIGTYIKGKL